MKKLICLLALVLCFCVWSISYGETPDGDTPSEETVCDKAGFTGALWGLCNAYCEATDCDNQSVNAADSACSKLYDNFISKSGGKEQLPCEKFGKPCEKLCDEVHIDEIMICRAQHVKALKACKDDKLCIDEANNMYLICSDNADVNADLCVADCNGLDCASECYELHLMADDRCYNQFCDNGCSEKLQACLDNNVDNMEKCLAGCKIIPGPIPTL
jgi:hypothetical protein